MILKAAVLQKDSRIVYVGHRHNDCFIAMRDVGVRYFNCVQGFVDAEGNFLDRHEAYEHAIKSGQIKEGVLNNCHILTSEDLY